MYVNTLLLLQLHPRKQSVAILLTHHLLLLLILLLLLLLLLLLILLLLLLILLLLLLVQPSSQPQLLRSGVTVFHPEVHRDAHEKSLEFVVALEKYKSLEYTRTVLEILEQHKLSCVGHLVLYLASQPLHKSKTKPAGTRGGRHPVGRYVFFRTISAPDTRFVSRGIYIPECKYPAATCSIRTPLVSSVWRGIYIPECKYPALTRFNTHPFGVFCLSGYLHSGM